MCLSNASCDGCPFTHVQRVWTVLSNSTGIGCQSKLAPWLLNRTCIPAMKATQFTDSFGYVCGCTYWSFIGMVDYYWPCIATQQCDVISTWKIFYQVQTEVNLNLCVVSDKSHVMLQTSHDLRQPPYNIPTAAQQRSL